MMAEMPCSTMTAIEDGFCPLCVKHLEFMSGPSARMLELLSLLQARRDWPGHLLAERLEVTTRTVRRDIDRLRDMGYEITSVKGPEGGYRLAAGADLPPLLFDDDQAVAIAIGLQHVSGIGLDIGEAAERALATVRQVMPSRLRHRLDAVDFSMVPARSGVSPEVLESVSRATRSRHTIRFDYGDQPGARLVEPHDVVARSGRWYLLAWDLDRDDWRIFRLDRLTPRSTPGDRFSRRPVPGDSPAAFVSSRLRGTDPHGEWPCVGTFDVAMPARDVAQWLSGVQLHEIDDGTTRVTLGSWSWAGLIASIIRLGAELRIVGPSELIAEANRLSGWLHTP